MYQDWDSPEPPLTLNGVRLDVVDRFTYLGSCLTKDSSIGPEINARISKARMAFANLLHLWCRNDVSLPVKGRVYNAAVRSVLLYGCETWPLRQQDVHRLEVFDHRCLRQLAKVGWSDRVSNLEVRKYVLGGNGSDTLPRKIKLCRLRWLGHVLRMEPHRLPHQALFSMPQTGWKRRPGGQQMTWQREMKNATVSLSRVGSSRLPGWDPKDNSTRWLDTLKDMAMNREQWRSCCYFLSGQFV